MIDFGEVLEWLNRPVSKTGRSARASWVQIPPSPPVCTDNPKGYVCANLRKKGIRRPERDGARPALKKIQQDFTEWANPTPTAKEPEKMSA